MSETVHDLLEHDEPTGLDIIKRGLAAQDDLNNEGEAALSALLWRRRTDRRLGLLGALMHRDCVRRIGVLPDHLEVVGATRSARALRELRTEIPYPDDRIKFGIIDWIEARPEFMAKARALDAELEDVTPLVWHHLQVCAHLLPDMPASRPRRSFLSRFRR